MSTEYLSRAISGTDLLNGTAVNCTSNHGASQLCHELVNLVRNPELQTENFHRSDYGFLGRGMFGTVFERKVGRNRYAIKIVENLYRIRKFKQEVELQKRAAREALAPYVYDHFVCQCTDKTYGIIVMDLVKDYVYHGRVQQTLNEMRISGMNGLANQLANALNNRLMQILQMLSELHIQIVDFQIMYHPELMLALDSNGVPAESIQVIDFGFTEDVGTRPYGRDYIDDQLQMYRLT